MTGPESEPTAWDRHVADRDGTGELVNEAGWIEHERRQLANKMLAEKIIERGVKDMSFDAESSGVNVELVEAIGAELIAMVGQPL